jgi:hypothetical protein
MRRLLAAALMVGVAMQANEAFAYACNNRYYGSISYSEHHPGTCSHHGGVSHWD